MNNDDESPVGPIKFRTSMIGVRVNDEQKELIEQAAEREGLQVSSFIIMLLVRLKILPERSLGALKRRPIPFYNALHGLLGIVNNIGGNFKQLASAMPETVGLHAAHASIIRTAGAITEMMRGKPLPAVNLYAYQGKLSDLGYELNDIVRSVNRGKPRLNGLGNVLISISKVADEITTTLTGHPVQNTDAGYLKDMAELSREELLAAMDKTASEYSYRSED